jgi:hypothetical protein
MNGLESAKIRVPHELFHAYASFKAKQWLTWITAFFVRPGAACNSSKGSKKLFDWIQLSYCRKRGINKNAGAEAVKDALRVPDPARLSFVLAMNR